MEVLMVILLGILMGRVGAELTLSVNATPTSVNNINQEAQYSQTLECDPGTNVYVLAIEFEYGSAWCICRNLQSLRCSLSFSSSQVSQLTPFCWAASNCTASFRLSPAKCHAANFASTRAHFTYACAPATPTLAIDSESSATGTSLTAGYSAAGNTASGRNASWVCSVEASDCSHVNVALLLLIRNGNNQTSNFSVPGHLEKFGVLGVSWSQGTYLTPFDVVLNVAFGSLLQNAYFETRAEDSITMTCRRQNVALPTRACNVPIASLPPVRKFGQALTAVHSSSGPETAGDWTCVVEAADCSTTTSVNVTLNIRNPPGGSTLYFSRNGRRQNNNALVTVNTPFAITLHRLREPSTETAFAFFRARQNISVACGRSASSPPQVAISLCGVCPPNICQGQANCTNSTGGFVCECPAGYVTTSDGLSCQDDDECRSDPSPCDVTARCNNTEGSFHCYCDPGVNLTDNGRGCQGASPPEQPQQQTQTSVVGAAVGGGVAALVVIAVVVVVIIVWLNRTQKAPRASERSEQQRRPNGVYEETGQPEDNHGAGAHVNPLNDIPDQHYANAGTAGAVTSENDTPYDVLGQKRPTADAKRDVIYSHLTENGNLAENVEYSYDRAGKGRRRDVITNAIYSTAPVSPHDEARPEDVEYSNECAETSKCPGAITDPGGPDVHPQSPAAKAKQDDGSDLKMKIKAAAQRNGEAAGDSAEGPIYFNAEAL